MCEAVGLEVVRLKRNAEGVVKLGMLKPGTYRELTKAETVSYTHLDFDGPLELLLALVAKHKMDLHNIPILELIDQYTRTVEQADPDPEKMCIRDRRQS